MKFKSKQVTHSADIVDLPVAGQSSAGRSFRARSRVLQSHPGKTALLFSVKQHLSFKASVCLADECFFEQPRSGRVAKKLLLPIQHILEREFGRLRVYRHHQLFVVNHHSLELLREGLLRARFHCSEISLTVSQDGSEPDDMRGLSLSWGIGQTRAEAELDRLGKVANQ